MSIKQYQLQIQIYQFISPHSLWHLALLLQLLFCICLCPFSYFDDSLALLVSDMNNTLKHHIKSRSLL